MSATITPYITGQQDDRDWRGGTCVRDYLVEGEPTVADLPVIGQPWTTQSDWPGTEYKVKTYGRVGRVRNSGGVWLDVLRVTGSTTVPVINVAGSMTGQVEKDMSGGEQFTVTADMIGAKRAEAEDCGKIRYPRMEDKVKQFMIGEYVYDSVSGALPSQSIGLAEDRVFCLTPAGNPARVGQYIYANAHNGVLRLPDADGEPYLTARTASSGTKDLTFCPVTHSGGTDTDITVGMIGRSFFMPTFGVAYFVRTDRYYMANVPQYPNNGRVQDWGPLAGRKYGPMVASGSPATDGSWRITNQLIAGMHDADGEPMLKVSRTFVRVPYMFSNDIWNPNIYPVWPVTATTWP